MRSHVGDYKPSDVSCKSYRFGARKPMIFGFFNPSGSSGVVYIVTRIYGLNCLLALLRDFYGEALKSPEAVRWTITSEEVGSR